MTRSTPPLQLIVTVPGVPVPVLRTKKTNWTDPSATFPSKVKDPLTVSVHAWLVVPPSIAATTT